MFCTKCGAELKDDVKFCTKCGTEIKKSVKEPKKAKTVGKKNGVWLAVGVCTILLCSSLGIAFAMKGKEAEPANNNILTEDEQTKAEEVISKKEEVLPEATQTLVAEKKSVWHDGVEIKMLGRLNRDNTLIKMALGNYMVQLAIPDTVIIEEYVLADSYSESWDGVTEACHSLVHNQKQNAIYLSVVSGGTVATTYQGLWERAREEEEFWEFQTPNGCNGFVLEEWMSVVKSEYDDSERMFGYVACVFDAEEQAMLLAWFGSEDDAEAEMFRDNVGQLVFRKQQDSDYVFRSRNLAENYEERLKFMWRKYNEMINKPTEYLTTNYEAVGEEYQLHYVYDLTDDGIPEIIYFGRPNWICIVGEKNAINVGGDSIYWGKEPGIFYTSLFWQMSGGWSQNKLVTDENGYLVLDCLASEYLETDGQAYWHLGVEIPEEDYWKIVEELESPYTPDARIYGDEYVAAWGGFQRSAKQLSDDYVYAVE